MSRYILVSPETIEEAVKTVESGDTIVFDDGEYVMLNTITIPDGVKLTSIYGIRRGRQDGA